MSHVYVWDSEPYQAPRARVSFDEIQPAIATIDKRCRCGAPAPADGLTQCRACRKPARKAYVARVAAKVERCVCGRPARAGGCGRRACEGGGR